MKLDDFFGIDIDKYSYETNRVLEFLGLRRKIEKTRKVSDLINAFDKDSPYVDVAKRQQLLLFLKPLISKQFLPHDDRFYTKDVNTGTDKDRRYNAEDKLLKIVLSVASGERYSALVEKDFKPDSAILRSLNKDADERYDRLKHILSENTREILEQFKIDKKILKPPKKRKNHFLGNSLINRIKLFNIPVTNIIITWLIVRAKRIKINFTMRTRIKIHIFLTPGIFI